MDAGAITTNNEELAQMLRKCFATMVHMKNIKFVPGVNSRLDEIQAAMFDIKLGYLDQRNTMNVK